MAVSKRLRFEILRRDNHTCRYCGATAPDVTLTVDHVVPVALGGADQPDNLVAACADCNTGKSSVPAGAPLVDDVATDAARWAGAMRQAAEMAHALHSHNRERFEQWWDSYDHPTDPWGHPRPVGWQDTIDSMTDAGLDGWTCEEAIRIAMSRPRDDTFRYFCGVVWTKLREHQAIARRLLDAEDGGMA